ncbi:hypothetical protein D9611_008267 [Ephemerocybe angulata]|uniref:F-box domain-containing protein n=1 Tax=Ephemerocybe angulata TaxID=980116 RepID=A0A8H5BJ31_9AGAR|nr:hypothetical protein D9611_008267 [Tulosesus angulatus]
MPFPSTFLPFLNTNYVPSLTEVAQLKALVQDWNQAITDLDRDLNSLQQAQRYLRRSLSPLQQVQRYLHRQREFCILWKKKHEAVLQPIRRVPDNVLSEIFLACLPCEGEGWEIEAEDWPEERPEAVIGRRRRPSVDLSHVCRLWRRVALGTPRLWVQAEIYLPSFQYSKEERILGLTHFVRALTRRSGTCPLSFKLQGTRVRRYDDPVNWWDFWLHPNALVEASVPFKKAVEELVGALNASSSRWRRFSLSGEVNIRTHGISPMKLFDAMTGPFPALHYIHLDRDAHFPIQRNPDKSARPPLINTPALQSVTILQPYGRPDNLPVTAWTNLKSLTLGSWTKAPPLSMDEFFGRVRTVPSVGMDPQIALRLLKPLIGLVHLNIHMDQIAPSEAAEVYPLANIATQPISLPRLQSLSLKGVAVAPGFARALTLPSLESMSFTSLQIVHRDIQEAGLLECLACFGCQITEFELDVVDFSDTFFVACTESLTQIKTLKIGELPLRRGQDQDREALREMCYHIGQDIATPSDRPTSMESFLRHLASPIKHLGAGGDRLNPRGYRAPNLEIVSLTWQVNLLGVEAAILDLLRARFGRSSEQPSAVQPLKKFTAHLFGLRAYIDIQRKLAHHGVNLGILDLEVIYYTPFVFRK